MSNTTTISLVELNARRVASNMKPLKAWKESKAKLADAIAKLPAAFTEATPNELAAQTVRPVDHVEPTILSKPKKGEAKLSDKLNKQKRSMIDSSVKGNPFTEMLRASGVNPKVARAKLRAAGYSAPYANTQQVRDIINSVKGK